MQKIGSAKAYVLTFLLLTAAVVPAGILFEEDFENPEVTSYSEGSNPETWERARSGFNSGRHGLTNKIGGDFSAPAGNDQAYAFRYTNTGLTSGEAQLGSPLAVGGGYRVSFDVVRDDGLNAGQSYNVKLIAFAAGADRSDCRSIPAGSTELNSVTGNAPSDGSFATVTFDFLPDAVTHAAEFGKDLGVRLVGSSSSAIIDNVSVTAIPGAGSSLALVTTDPLDDSTGIQIAEPIRAIFSKDLAFGSGNITLRNLTNSVDTVMPVGDSRLTLSGPCLEIRPGTEFVYGADFAILIDAGVIESVSGDVFGGILNATEWNFATANGDALFTPLAELKDHIEGTITLSAAEIEAHKLSLDGVKSRFAESSLSIAALFELVEAYDTEIGPLWIARGQFDRRTQANDLDWTIYNVMQGIMDRIYTADVLAVHETLLDGYKFGSSAHFPGALDPPAVASVHTATVDGSFPETFGRDTQGWTDPARKPTGCYHAPGSIVTVTVPPALVNAGYTVRVGAHSWDLEFRRPFVRRLDRATRVYELNATTIKLASPYGGGIYIEVPPGADAGVVNIDITGAVRSPYFSAKSFHSTTLSEWQSTERNHPAPWADFQTEKFMMQVPTDWIYALDDPITLMAEWDSAMDAMNELMGFPLARGKETMYPQVDVINRSSVFAPGYPSVNKTYNPNSSANGYANNHLVRGPRSAPDYEFHEQGHAYGFPKFGGETEANVNLHHVAVMHRKFGVDLDEAFADSRGFASNPNRTLDNTAVTWMTVFNFAPREVPMAAGEKAYQLKGHAKFVDIVRMFGWEGLDAFWYSFNEDLENGVSSPSSDDDMLLRLCQSVGWDLRPLFHFWGIHPSDPAGLQVVIDSEGLLPSPQIYELLQHYQSLVPADNAAFQAFALNWWNKQPSINGNWTEREHARQWDTTELFSAGDQQRPDGEIYNEASAAEVQARVQELIDLYFPNGNPDYTNWAAQFPTAELADPAVDLDGDLLSNNEERIWGLNPTTTSSSNQYVARLDAAGSFSYTRRNPALSGLSFSIWTSSNLVQWNEATDAVQVSSELVDDVETVTVNLGAGSMDGSHLFVLVRAVGE